MTRLEEIKERLGRLTETTKKENQILADLAWAVEELEHFQAIVARLPQIWRLDDAGQLVRDVPVVVHDHPAVFVFTSRHGLYRPSEGPDWWEMRVREYIGGRLRGMVAGSHTGSFPPSKCYNTIAAAEASV